VLEKEMSYINLAEHLLGDTQQPMDLYELFDAVVKKSGSKITDDQFADFVTRFYADLTSSAKFVYIGQNRWDLKDNHGVDLWEKDGSYYNEYKEVYDAFLETRLEKAHEMEEKHQAMLEARREKEAMIQAARESQDSPALEIHEPEDVVLSTADLAETLGNIEEDIEVFGPEEIVEEDTSESTTAGADYEEDFDEEKYNEIMDAYEDQYEDN